MTNGWPESALQHPGATTRGHCVADNPCPMRGRSGLATDRNFIVALSDETQLSIG